MYVLSYIYLASVYKMALLSSSVISQTQAAMEETQKTEQSKEDPILDLAISYALNDTYPEDII